MIHFDTSAAVYAFCGIAVGVLSLKSLISYHKLHTSLSLYYGLSGLFGALYFFSYSLPFFFTADTTVLRASIALGDLSFYVVIFWQARIIWHLSLAEKMHFWIIGWPVGLLSAYAWYLYTFAVADITPRLNDPNAVYDAPIMARRIDMFLALLFLGVGILLARQAVRTQDKTAKLRLSALSIMYFVVTAVTLYNLLSSQNNHASVVVYVPFFLAFGFVLVALLRVKRISD